MEAAKIYRLNPNRIALNQPIPTISAAIFCAETQASGSSQASDSDATLQSEDRRELRPLDQAIHFLSQ